MRRVAIAINGQRVEREVAPRTHLGDFIREQAGLTGTHLGCEHGVCGACVVLLDGQPIRSCITFAVACEGRAVTTIEGHEGDPVMARLRAAFSARHALQCGYCTPGMLASARDIVLRLPTADERQVRAELSGNLCRCTGYQGIVDAVVSVLEDLQAQPDAQVEALREAAARASQIEFPVAGAVGSPAAAQFQEFSRADQVVDRELHQAGVGVKAPPQAPGAAFARSAEPAAVIRDQFELPCPSDQVWALMSDPARVAACLPGAFLTGQEGDRVMGGVALRFGPMQAKFEGDAVLALDPPNRRARLQGRGRDRMTQSRAEGDIAWEVIALGDQTTRVVIEMRHSLQGPFAQFSRGGLVQEFVRRIVQQFAAQVGRALTASPAGTASQADLPSDRTPSFDQAPDLNPVSLMIGMLWARLRRLFGTRD